MDKQPSARPPFDNTVSVIIWALLTGGLLAALSSRGLHIVAVAFGLVVLAAGLVVLAFNWSRNSTDWTGRRASDRRRVIAALVACAALPMILLAVMTADGLGTPHGGKLWVVRAGLLTAVVATSAICLSGLMDWSYTTPLRRGPRYGPRPCTTSTSEEWRSLTSNWLLHRMIAYTTVRVAVIGLIGIVLAGVLPKVPQPITSVLAAAAAILVAYVLNRVTPVAALSQNPPLRVGDAVILAEEYGAGVENRPIYYVVDVAVEGIQLRELKDGVPIGPEERSHDRTLEISDINRLLRARTNFTGCSAACSRVNKYCPLKMGEPTHPPNT
jgi:hypothetical protein